MHLGVGTWRTSSPASPDRSAKISHPPLSRALAPLLVIVCVAQVLSAPEPSFQAGALMGSFLCQESPRRLSAAEPQRHWIRRCCAGQRGTPDRRGPPHRRSRPIARRPGRRRAGHTLRRVRDQHGCYARRRRRCPRPRRTPGRHGDSAVVSRRHAAVLPTGAACGTWGQK